MWHKLTHGLSIPYVKNEISRDVFEFMQRNIQFSGNSKIKQKDVCGYNPLFEVSHPLKIMMKGMRGVLTARKNVTIDESMIKNRGRAITYVQYMPAKPIKHDIKVFDICCALSTILLGFKVYIGQEDDYYNTALGIFDELVKEAGITSARRRTICTDNY